LARREVMGRRGAVARVVFGVGAGWAPPRAQSVPEKPRPRVGFLTSVASRHALSGQHDQVVGEDAQPDRALKMPKSAIEAPGEPKRPF
jgi:hypothetical protein